MQSLYRHNREISNCYTGATERVNMYPKWLLDLEKKTLRTSKYFISKGAEKKLSDMFIKKKKLSDMFLKKTQKTFWHLLR